MVAQDVINTCKAMLEERLAELKQALKDHFGNEMSYTKDAVGELSNYDNHPGDTATELYEREKDIALNDHAEQEYKEVKAALARIEAGTFGICKVSGKEIPGERLLAMPTAETLVEYSDHNVFQHNRPIEEDVIHPRLDDLEATEDPQDENHNFYDAEDTIQQLESYGSSETPSDFANADKDYDDMTINADEQESGAEDIENFLLADMEGKFSGVNEKHEAYEDYLDDEGVNSITYD